MGDLDAVVYLPWDVSPNEVAARLALKFDEVTVSVDQPNTTRQRWCIRARNEGIQMDHWLIANGVALPGEEE